MKYKLLTLFLLLTTCSYSQTNFGLRFGLTFPNQQYSIDGVDYKYDAFRGIQFAAMMEIPLSEKISLQPEVSFFQKGTRLHASQSSEEGKLRVNYIDVPVMLKYKFNIKSVPASIGAGPYVAYALSGFSEYDGEKIKFMDEDWEYYRRVNFGSVISGGVGLDLPNGNLIFLDFRYSFDILSFYNIEEEFFDGEYKAFNKVFGIGIGYMFN